MATVLQRHHVNAINVSIRHSLKDPGTRLAWAMSEVFCFVLYYEQGTSTEARGEVLAWTRQLIDHAVNLGGSYYLPYQISGTRQQFEAAYPRSGQLFELKKRVDPSNKFRNTLWDKYYR
jgi:hypothetical protein